ncbi:DUF2059 domain-containing protein [Psychrobacter arenosus]|uniref:DUF2059 domain-containing protein n=1 Tax=Psychrobacter arenosus TaxID=256326 RepID=UPI001D126DAC|nr:DUF2059 domain-containing protein [Psychrobacter arenosus]
MMTNQTHKLNLLPQSVRLSLLIALTTTMGMSAAHADLVIHNEPTAKIVGVSPITATSTNTPANTATMPTEASIIKLMAVMRIDEQIEAIVNGQQAAIAVINERSKTGELANDDDERQRAIREQVQGLLGQYAKIMTGSIAEATDSETLTQAYIAAAKAYYTQQEVDAQIKFYDTPVGQSILDKQPQVTAAFLKQALPKDMDATEEQLGQMLPQIKKIFKDIF